MKKIKNNFQMNGWPTTLDKESEKRNIHLNNLAY